MVKHVHEDNFLEETLKNVINLSEQHPNIQIDECKMRLGNVKNQLPESVKQIRNSIGGSSVASETRSKRDREAHSTDRKNRTRFKSPGHQ